jgi:hypothetical protein
MPPVRRLRLLMAKKGQLCGGSDSDVAKRRVHVTTCLASAEQDVVTTRNRTPPICVVLPNSLLPKDLWTDGTNGDGAAVDSTVSRYLRTAFYSRPDIPKPVADYNNLVPNVRSRCLGRWWRDEVCLLPVGAQFAALCRRRRSLRARRRAT